MIHKLHIQEASFEKKKPTLIMLGILGLIGLRIVFGYRYFFFQSTKRPLMSEAHTSLLASRISGTVERVLIEENT